ncbi:MAG: hypothetical protein CVU62_13270 [Deltaproteobacteria bacterium HGW-Deltaproteobacteria-2]|jgi:phage terminase small subunit|nr:MAG: hypothetical protein CVU62_13270 [Deltaproteobacteria bacterium HGW-Deltaproteobacteria-2]
MARVKKEKKKEKKQTVRSNKKIPKIEQEALTDKEDWLCREFAAGSSQVRAYMRVHPTTPYESAKTLASRLFTKVHIKRRIKELQEERNKRLEISADKVLAELAKLSFYDSRDFYDSDGRLKPINELDPDHAAVIAGIETIHKVIGDEKDGMAVLTKIKLSDRGANLERLGRHLKLFTDRTEHSGKDGGPITVIVRKFSDDDNSSK